MKKTAVLVTTAHRGVFFGYQSIGLKQETISLEDARNVLYWSTDVKGFLGLAATGPSKSCRIGPKVPELTLVDVTSVAKLTPEAVEKFEAAPWSL